MIGALAFGWGGALILVGRSYDTSEERLAAEIGDERSARAQLVAKRFGRRRAAGREPQRERSGRSTQT